MRFALRRNSIASKKRAFRRLNMETIEKCIDVNVPLSTVYNQWTQFEEFPRFMENIESVEQQDETGLHWVAKIAGTTVEWDAEISEQVPDKRIVWYGANGPMRNGMVSFNPINDDITRVTLRIDYEPEGLVEQAGDKLGILSNRVQGDLERFKEFIESRGSETGAWRGKI
jgi:uncharacterized membrane protein